MALANCHPEAGAARRGTSQAVNRYRDRRGRFRQITHDLSCVTSDSIVRSLTVCAARDDCISAFP